MTGAGRAVAWVSVAGVCVAMGACETTPRETEPMQRVDVRVNESPGAVREPAPAAEAPPAATRAPTPEPAKVEPAPARQPEPPARQAEELAPEQWWLLTPEPQAGRIRVVAKGEAGTLVEARQNAVDNGRESLAKLRGAPPVETEFERSQPVRRPDGMYEFYVLISCDR